MANAPLVIAHRGVHGQGLTENTMEAFEAAISKGADMIEFDVRRTATGELIVIHDHRHRGVPIDSVSRAQLEQQTGLRAPLLGEVLDWARGRIALDVELKEDGYVEEVAPLLQAFRAGGGSLIVTSFVESAIGTLNQSAPELVCGLLLTWTSHRAIERAAECGAKVLLPDVRLAREHLLADAAAAGLDLIVWDLFAERDQELIADVRLAGVITDDVPGAIKARASLPDAAPRATLQM